MLFRKCLVGSLMAAACMAAAGASAFTLYYSAGDASQIGVFFNGGNYKLSGTGEDGLLTPGVNTAGASFSLENVVLCVGDPAPSPLSYDVKIYADSSKSDLLYSFDIQQMPIGVALTHTVSVPLLSKTVPTGKYGQAILRITDTELDLPAGMHNRTYGQIMGSLELGSGPATPEPFTMVLAAGGLALALVRRRKA